ncbi:hypothetical protein EVG20_g2765 [Dentipellis fragilis]|uniref:Uncharacterized protein n=1 Tax=Dentipellis fragilis TaxID=205917 RepID=A0A4Y9Z8U3_9AGAM|nr:hypothetical protein EVG20_g2765 [Dentipellis fragilis]
MAIALLKHPNSQMASTINQAEALDSQAPLDNHEDDNEASGQYTLDNSDDCHPLMIALARIFDNIGVSYVVWGRMCLDFHGVPTSIRDLSFVFPDNEVEKARRVLSQRPHRFVQCPCQSDRSNSAGWEFVCADPIREERRCHYPELGPMEVALPEVHYVYCRHINVELWKQSDVLPGADISEGSIDVVRASPRRERQYKEKGRKNWYMNMVSITDRYRLRYLAIPAMCEQSLFITARDWHVDCAKLFCYAGYAVDYIDGDQTGPSRDGILGETLRTLLVEKDFMIVEKYHVS